MSAPNGGVSDNDQQRDLMIQAAVAYDETQKRIASLEDQLNRAVAALEAKNGEIDNLSLLLTQERNRNENYRNARDQAVAERAEALAILGNVRALVEKTEIPSRLHHKRSDSVADNASGQLAIEGGGQSSTERGLSNADASQAVVAA
jgi:predicted  nucleic acid-binding Zn-ribbon protein